MAESNDGWFGSWLSAAKNKSSEVLDFVKRDLEEFGHVVKNEATNVVSSTGTVIERTLGLNEPQSTANSMKRSISSFIGQMNDALNPSPDDSDTEAIMIVEGEMVTLTKLQQAIYELQKNEATFLIDPDETLHKQYQCWLEIIDDQLSEERLLKHLSSSTTLNNQYMKLVPNNVTHILFWKRYLFKKALLEDEIARTDAMERREIQEKQMTEDNLKWDQEDFADDVELSEEEQIRLLEQYEQETKLKNGQKHKIMETIGEETTVKVTPKNSCNEVKNISQEFISNEKENKMRDEKFHTINKKPSELKIIENDSVTSLGTNGSNSSTDDDWEKISDH